MRQTAQQRLLEYAQDKIGFAELATRLDVSKTIVRSWMDGEDMAPRALIALADLIDELHELSSGSASAH